LCNFSRFFLPAVKMDAGAEKGHSQETRAFDEHCDTEADEEDVAVEVGGETHKFRLPPTATVLVLGQCMERGAGFKSAEVKLNAHGDSREALENGDALGGSGACVSPALVWRNPRSRPRNK
jgi:hypothetical protein